jgi:hypothetical protein
MNGHFRLHDASLRLAKPDFEALLADPRRETGCRLNTRCGHR